MTSFAVILVYSRELHIGVDIIDVNVGSLKGGSHCFHACKKRIVVIIILKNDNANIFLGCLKLIFIGIKAIVLITFIIFVSSTSNQIGNFLISSHLIFIFSLLF
jgi:hypothetical protein